MNTDPNATDNPPASAAGVPVDALDDLLGRRDAAVESGRASEVSLLKYGPNGREPVQGGRMPGVEFDPYTLGSRFGAGRYQAVLRVEGKYQVAATFSVSAPAPAPAEFTARGPAAAHNYPGGGSTPAAGAPLGALGDGLPPAFDSQSLLLWMMQQHKEDARRAEERAQQAAQQQTELLTGLISAIKGPDLASLVPLLKGGGGAGAGDVAELVKLGARLAGVGEDAGGGGAGGGAAAPAPVVVERSSWVSELARGIGPALGPVLADLLRPTGQPITMAARPVVDVPAGPPSPAVHAPAASPAPAAASSGAVAQQSPPPGVGGDGAGVSGPPAAVGVGVGAMPEPPAWTLAQRAIMREVRRLRDPVLAAAAETAAGRPVDVVALLDPLGAVLDGVDAMCEGEAVGPWSWDGVRTGAIVDAVCLADATLPRDVVAAVVEKLAELENLKGEGDEQG